MDFRIAQHGDFASVCAFYDVVTEATQGLEHTPLWDRSIYPTDEDLRSYLEAGELVLGEEDGQIVAASALTRTQTEGYEKVAWPSGADDSHVLVIHLLATSPKRRGQGLARKLLDELVRRARAVGARAIRLDALPCNLPAHKLYESYGFTRMGSVEVFYEDTGWMEFVLYELAL